MELYINKMKTIVMDGLKRNDQVSDFNVLSNDFGGERKLRSLMLTLIFCFIFILQTACGCALHLSLAYGRAK